MSKIHKYEKTWENQESPAKIKLGKSATAFKE